MSFTTTWWRASDWSDQPEAVEVERETERCVYERVSSRIGALSTRRRSKRGLYRKRAEALNHMRERARSSVDRLKRETHAENTRLGQIESELRKALAEEGEG